MIPDWKFSTNEQEKYQLYLASREWSQKKEQIKTRSRGICERCRYVGAEQVHHLTYAHKYNEPLEDLLHVCEPCHKFISAKSNHDPKLNAPVYFHDKIIENVYLAGKITNDRWRDELVTHYSDENDGIVYDAWRSSLNFNLPWQTVYGALPIPDGRRLNLTGPFWRPAGDRGGHGAITENPGIHCCGEFDNHGCDITSYHQLLTTIEKAIALSDLVFAWIDSRDCYGTLVELGYARALRTKIAVVTPPEFDQRELWMALSLCDYLSQATSPKKAWEDLWDRD